VIPADGPSAAGSWTGRYAKIVADGTSTDNGLSTATWVDLDNNGTADVVYAGDLKGNLWKFDISSSNTANWSVAFVNTSGAAQPLYTARSPNNDVLPITGAPQFTFPSMGGVMVSFATGLANTSTEYPRAGVTQRVFGIWDRPDFTVTPKTAARPRALPSGVSTLVQRTLTRSTTTGIVTVAAGAAVDYLATTGSMDGWFINLPGSSEMVVSNLEYRLNNIMMTSIRPISTNGVSCSDLPLATLFVFDPVTGLPNSDVLGPPTLVNGVATSFTIGIPVDDQKLRFANDRTPAPSLTACTKGEPGCTCTGTGAAEVCSKAPKCPDGSGSLRGIGRDTDTNLCFSQSNSRIQWREVPGLRTK
jgi:type IV pilus assembly protein PilY1